MSGQYAAVQQIDCAQPVAEVILFEGRKADAEASWLRAFRSYTEDAPRKVSTDELLLRSEPVWMQDALAESSRTNELEPLATVGTLGPQSVWVEDMLAESKERNGGITAEDLYPDPVWNPGGNPEWIEAMCTQ